MITRKRDYSRGRAASRDRTDCPAPARIYIPELLPDVLDGTIDPGRVFDYQTDLDHIADAYRAMDERRAIKSLVRIGAV